MIAYLPGQRAVSSASPQASELAHKLEYVIREYRQSHPHMGDGEIQQALQLAASRIGAGVGRSRLMVAVLLALGFAALLGALLLSQAV